MFKKLIFEGQGSKSLAIVIMSAVLLIALTGCSPGYQAERDMYECRHGNDPDHPHNYDDDHTNACLKARGWGGAAPGDALMQALFPNAQGTEK